MKYEVIDSKFKDLLLNIKNYFSDEKNETLFKQRNIIKLLEYDSKKYAVKSFKIPHLLNKIVYKFFRESKAARSYKNSIKLVDLGINTPKPIGYIELDTFLLFKESYYVSEFLDYDFEIRELIHYVDYPDRDIIIRKFMEFTFDLHNKGVYHVDYSPGNVIVKKIGNEYNFFIIDVNRMIFKDLNLDLRMKNLAKISPSDKFNQHMIKEYASVSGLDINLLQERLDYHLHEQEAYLLRKKRLKKIYKKKA